MGGGMTNLAKQRIVRTETMAKFPYLIDVTYEIGGVSCTEHYANSDDPITYGGRTYQPAFFTVVPPEMRDSSVTDGKLTLSTVDQTWILKVRNADKRMKCRFVACIVHDADGGEIVEEIETMTFTLIKASWNESTLSFTMMFDDRLNLSVPLDMANELKVPGLS